ncbi:hypothetical protein CAL25_17335 [Bordetella genomosp. 5]|uniref:Carrier domain-containing protein n=2 Tax=Bordetella genomosp. 5 TaxID=1395608 RepID=A0A261TFE8_9BORD|nr:hypothetical protein CAL25_17335 [Bordetella genomosp. 5]
MGAPYRGSSAEAVFFVMSDIPTSDAVRHRIAALLEAEFGISAAALLADTAFTEIDSKFDSLALLEVQFLLEAEYKIEFPTMQPGDVLPVNVSELAAIVLERMQAHG